MMRNALVLAALGAMPGPPALAQVPRAGLDASYSCVTCHAPKRRAFISGVHAERGIRCHDCHGGNTTVFELPGAHRGSFVGSPTKLGIARLCASCHSDPNRMRQYGLPEDQLAGLRASRHGQLLERGNADAPTCTDCHDAHLIRRASDARSNTYPANIPGTCARCHDDAALMGKYGLPTSQSTEYRSSAHGVALFERENHAAPTCIGCHGSHEALPPGVDEVADVCGQCHVLVRQAFFAGAHGAATARGALPGCLACHSNHGTEPVRGLVCGNCHAADEPATAVIARLGRVIATANDELAAADTALQELVRSGRVVTDTRFRYRSALTYYRQMAQAQHGLDVETMEDLALRITSTTRDIRRAADVAAENRWERQLLLVPVWFVVLAVAALVGFRLSELRRASSQSDT
ncbi:MAG TPA: hypothetical protein VGA37_10130 [Gemmatimonadales bacterium]